MEFDRIFTFGCSFTSWSWPTWANIIGTDLGLPFQNWGRAGIGNDGIFCKIVECDLRNKFTERDLILVVWSGWSREDRYKNGRWVSGGEIHHSEFYGEEFIKKYWSLQNDILKNSTYIIAANNCFNINFQAHMTEPPYNNLEIDKMEKDLVELYDKHIPKDFIFEYCNSKEFVEICEDSHPDVLSHLSFVKNVVYKKLGFKLKNETESLFNSIHQQMIDSFEKTDSYDTRHKKVKQILLNSPSIKGNYVHCF